MLDTAEKIAAFETTRAMLKSLGKPQRLRGNILIAYSTVINVVLFVFVMMAIALDTLPDEGVVGSIKSSTVFQTFADIFGDKIIMSLVTIMCIQIGKTLSLDCERRARQQR